jgi:hypothetical protein
MESVQETGAAAKRRAGGLRLPLGGPNGLEPDLPSYPFRLVTMLLPTGLLGRYLLGVAAGGHRRVWSAESGGRSRGPTFLG